MANKPRSLDEVASMKYRMRQTVSPLVTKTVGELRSPHLSQLSAADPEQSIGSCPQATEKPHSKGGRGRPVTFPKDLVMDGGCFVGIDVSKARLDGHIRQRQSFQHENSEDGIAEILTLLRPLSVILIVVEATGGLEVPLVRALQKVRLPVAVINPRQARDFAKATGALAKTDAIDAAILAHFAEAIRPEPRALPDEQTQWLDAVLTRRRQLIDMRTMERNRLSGCADTKVRADIQAHLDWLERHIDDADQGINDAVRDNPDWQARDRLQQSVPGIGKVTSRTLLASLPELGMASSKKLSALVGLAPFAHDSGKHRGKRRVFGGRAEVRSTLYMAAMSASRKDNNPLGQFYQRLRRAGKEFKVAIIAVARKLLTIVNAVVRSGMAYRPDLPALELCHA